MDDSKIKAQDVLEEASTIITGKRQETHGDKLVNHINIGRLWSAYLTNRFGKELFIRANEILIESLETFKEELNKTLDDEEQKLLHFKKRKTNA